MNFLCSLSFSWLHIQHQIWLYLLHTSGLMLGNPVRLLSPHHCIYCTWSGPSVYRRRTSRPLFPRPLVSLWSLCCCLGLWLHLGSGLKQSDTLCKKRETERERKEQIFCCWDLWLHSRQINNNNKFDYHHKGRASRGCLCPAAFICIQGEEVYKDDSLRCNAVVSNQTQFTLYTHPPAFIFT